MYRSSRSAEMRFGAPKRKGRRKETASEKKVIAHRQGKRKKGKRA